MKLLSRAFVAVAGVFLCSFGCLSSASAATNYVAYGNFYFRPSDLTIHMGDTVIWTNAGGTHTVTGLSSGEPLCGGSTANACTNLFNIPGTFRYQCDFHYSIGMTGVVQVLPSPAIPATLTNASWTNGNFVFTAVTTPNHTNIVQAATNLAAASWISLDTNVPATSAFIFTDTKANQFPRRFYRVVQP